MADKKDSELDAAQALADDDIVATTQDVSGTLSTRRTTLATIKAFFNALTNPMTTAGDVIVGGTGGAAERLAAGSNGQVLKMTLGAPAWAAESGGGAGVAPVVTESGTALDATGANAGNYTRFTNAGAKTYTFDSAESYSVNDEYHGRNVGAGDLTLTAAGTFTLNAPAGGTVVIPAGGTFTVKIVAAAEADVFGVTVAA